MGKDLGTYWVRVEFSNARGFLYEWNTGHRYTRGGSSCKPLDAVLIPPTWDDEADLFSSMEFMFTEGNYACDCNLGDFIARAHHEPDPNMPCGETLDLIRLTAIRPDMTEHVLWESSNTLI